MPPDSHWVAVARLTRTRGSRGELSGIPLATHVERFQSLGRVHLGGRPYDVESVWQHGERFIFKFRGIDSISDAEKLAGLDVCVRREERAPLPEGEYYFSDLIGCRVLDWRSGNRLGTVRSVEEFGGPPLLAVRPEGKEEDDMLIPFAAAICRHIDTAAQEIRVDLPEGLKDLDS
ncbi:MAG: ribosome maturation factor RimM [Bryobacteraceae bacterium]